MERRTWIQTVRVGSKEIEGLELLHNVRKPAGHGIEKLMTNPISDREALQGVGVRRRRGSNGKKTEWIWRKRVGRAGFRPAEKKAGDTSTRRVMKRLYGAPVVNAEIPEEPPARLVIDWGNTAFAEAKKKTRRTGHKREYVQRAKQRPKERFRSYNTAAGTVAGAESTTRQEAGVPSPGKVGRGRLAPAAENRLWDRAVEMQSDAPIPRGPHPALGRLQPVLLERTVTGMRSHIRGRFERKTAS